MNPEKYPPVQAPVTGSFQGRIAVASLQRAFLVKYLSVPYKSLALSLFAADSDPPRVLKQTLAWLRGGAGNAESSTDDEQDGTDIDSLLPRQTAPLANASVDPLLPHLAVSYFPGGSIRGRGNLPTDPARDPEGPPPPPPQVGHSLHPAYHFRDSCRRRQCCSLVHGPGPGC